MRAVREPARSIFGLARHIHRAIAGAGGEDDLLCLKARAALKDERMRPIFNLVLARDELFYALALDDLDGIALELRLEIGCESRALRLTDAKIVLDGEGIDELSAEALGDDGDLLPFSRGIERRCGARRPAADDGKIDDAERRHLLIHRR